MNELIMLQKANKAYNSLEDAESKDIFESRLLYSVTEDIKHIHNMVKEHTNFIVPLPSNEKISSDLVFIENSCKTGKAIIIYGAGKVGRIIKDLLKNIQIECFSDINIDLQASGVNGIPVISPQTLVSKYNKDAVIVLAVWKQYHKKLTDFFTGHGINGKNIINGLELINFQSNHDNQYFDPELINYSDNEIFVDAGCFDFQSSIRLAQQCNDLKKIYAFEPDRINFEICQEQAKTFTGCEVKLFKTGLWSCNNTLSFNSYGGGGSCIVESGTTKIPVAALDNVIEEDGASFIKMDIEGAELEALKGAKKTIEKFRPKLAVSIYHKPEDIIEIPMYIINLNMGYRLFLRHYTNWTVDTILYAL